MRRPWTVGGLAFAIVLVLAANVALAAAAHRTNGRPTWDRDRKLVILIIGSDWGPPRPGSPLEGRADGLHLLAVDTKTRKATIVDIPRDSVVGGTKVNGHLTTRGPRGLKSIMASYTGIDIDFYALTNFRGLRGMVDAMGGVQVKLDRPIRDSAARANIDGGRQRLNGKEALAFSRARKTIPGGDFTRAKHHGRLMRAAHRQLRRQDTDLITMTRLLGAFSRNTETDIPRHQLFRLAQLAVQIKPSDVRQIPLSGPTGFVGAASVVFLRPGSAFSDIRRGRIGP